MHIDSHVREVYADMHQSGGVQHGTRYGEPYFWGYYFIVSSALMAVHHMKLWANIVRRKQIGNTVKDNMKDLWVSKVRKEKFYSLKDFFVQGSDIENNFGILIAIRDIQAYDEIFTVYRDVRDALIDKYTCGSMVSPRTARSTYQGYTITAR